MKRPVAHSVRCHAADRTVTGEVRIVNVAFIDGNGPVAAAALHTIT